VVAVLAPSVIWAAPDNPDVPGEAVLSTGFEFVKFTVNGKSTWENHEYTGRNKTLVIMGLARDQENVVVLTPRTEGYEPYTLVIAPSIFKRRTARVRGRRVAIYRMKKRIKFKKVVAAKPAPKKAKKAKKK
ncbi:MAG TPA: hypothetical protein DCQ06_13405, partial [Myxococcales bacterium]|nr:hypothetical protein [Myxococcales bacterium]